MLSWRWPDAGKKLVSSLCWHFGIHAEKLTPRSDLLKLIKLLRPHHLGISLIRLGSSHDGGYLLPDDLAGIRYCFSPGVGSVAAFESDLLEKGIFSYLADYSVDGPPESLKQYHFEKIKIGVVDTAQIRTLGTWIRRNVPDDSGDLLLQMDIEGDELSVLLSTPVEILERFRIAIVEFHSFHKIADPHHFKGTLDVFTKLLCLFEIAHVHPNNVGGSVSLRGIEVPRILEITFLRRDRVRDKQPVTTAKASFGPKERQREWRSAPCRALVHPVICFSTRALHCFETDVSLAALAKPRIKIV